MWKLKVIPSRSAIYVVMSVQQSPITLTTLGNKLTVDSMKHRETMKHQLRKRPVVVPPDNRQGDYIHIPPPGNSQQPHPAGATWPLGHVATWPADSLARRN